MLLQLTDGTTTVTLSGTSPVLGCTYFPATPQRTAGELLPVTETAEVNLRGTESAIRSKANSIETLLRQAVERRETGAGDRVFVQYKPVDGDAATYRSEVTDGRVVWSSNPGLRRLGDTSPTVQVAVIWTRAFWWEGAEAEISISANGQAAATGGRTIYNDPANGNWVQMAAAQVSGVLPAAARLEITNTAGSTKNFRKVFLGVNAYSDPNNYTHYLQGEARLSGGSVASDASHSNGQALSFTVSGTPVTFAWTLTAAAMQRTKGRRVRLLARFAGTTGALFVTPQVRSSAGVALWTGDELAIGPLTYEAWRDLGIVPLPPGGYDGAYAEHQLALVFRGTGLGELDVLQLTTVDSYLYLEMPVPGVAIANNAAAVHDGIEGRAYVLASGVRTGLPTSFGGPLLLQPGVIQRIYILWQIHAGATAGEGDAPIADTASVRLYYRPRRVTV